MQSNQASLSVGDSFVLKDLEGSHLHIIVAQEGPRDENRVMMVYISTAKSHRDTTTIINVGEHPFLTEESWVRYQNIKVVQRLTLTDKIATSYGKVSDTLLLRIQKGIQKSKFVAKDKRELFREWQLNELYNQTSH